MGATEVLARLPKVEQAMQDEYENWGETFGEWDKRNPRYTPEREKRWREKQKSGDSN